MAKAHKHVGAGKYAENGEKSSSEKKKQFQSFKAEIVKSVVNSLSKTKGAHSSKKRRVMDMEEFNMDNFCDLSVSDDQMGHKSSPDTSDNDSNDS